MMVILSSELKYEINTEIKMNIPERKRIIATERSTVGFPEIRLNIFPGLGGTQRMPRRSGLINTADPINGDAGFTAVLTGKNFKALDAAAINMIDAMVPAADDVDAFAERFLVLDLVGIDILDRVGRAWRGFLPVQRRRHGALQVLQDALLRAAGAHREPR